MTRVLALVAGGLCAAAAAGASPDPNELVIPPQDLSKARDLVRRLGSEAYRDREDAHAELVRMGRAARPALLEAAGSDPDPEVRFRCARLLPRAAADDLKARLDTFLADAEGKYEHDLPGLKQFRKVVGQDDKARALFADVVKSPYNVELLQALDRTPTEAGRAIADRRSQLFGQINPRFVGGRVAPQPPTPIALPDVACLLFAETLTPTAEIPRMGPFGYVTGVTFLQQPASITALAGNGGAAHAEVYRRVVGGWMDNREDAQDLNQLVYVAGQQLKNLPQSTPLLRRILASEGVNGYTKGQAIQYLTQGGKKEEMPHVLKLLASEAMVTTVWFNNPGNPNQNQQYTCLMKDVALAHLVTLTGQKMQDYGFQTNPGNFMQPQSIGSYAFTTEQARAAAMVKFGFWRLKESLKDPAAAGAEPKKDAPPQPAPAPVPPGK